MDFVLLHNRRRLDVDFFKALQSPSNQGLFVVQLTAPRKGLCVIFEVVLALFIAKQSCEQS